MSPGLPEPKGDRGEAQGQQQKAMLPHLAVPDSREEVLSYVTVKGAVKHTIIPNPSAKICFVSLTEASDVMERMIISNDDCVYPVSVPVSPHRNDTSDDNNNSLEDIGVVSQTGSI